jgi:two-component system, NtrC family, sensor kinase
MAYLIITSGQSAGTSYTLAKCPLSVGRDITRDVQLLDEQVSRKHLVIDRTPEGKYTAKAEPKAKNGMLVNDQQVAEAVLNDRDRIRIGETNLLFLATDIVSQLNAVLKARVWSKQSTAQTVKGKLPS